MFRFFLIIAFVAFLSQIVLLDYTDNNFRKSDDYVLYNFPASVVKLVSLEFSGIVSDVMLLNLRSYIGKSLESETGVLELDNAEWEWFADKIDIISELDPLFYDVYYFGSTILSMNPDFVDRNIALLSRASANMSDEWYFSFLLGWAYYFQKGDNIKAAESLQESYRRNDRNTLLASFASRLLYEGNRTENAIIFLRSIMAENKNIALNSSYEMRLETLEMIYLLEQLRDRFQKENGSYPQTLDQLIQSGYLASLPRDPFGGEFYMDDFYQIKTTSDLGAVKGKTKR